MKVGTKLFMGFTLVVLLLLAISFFSGMNIFNLNKQFSAVEDTILPGTLAMKDVGIFADETYDQMMTYIQYGDAGAKDNAYLYLNRLQEIETGYFMHGTEDSEQFAADVAMASTIIDFYYSVAAVINYKDHGEDVDTLLEETIIPSFRHCLPSGKRSVKERKSIQPSWPRCRQPFQRLTPTV